MQLSELAAGDAGRIASVTAESALRIRLLGLGLLPGTRVAVRAAEAPEGDMTLWLRGGALVINRDEAACVRMDDGIS
ncbi:MAG: FeoA domain-containing protein [Oscillospiraceae bacterium]|jgi:ferrous iron transport protein A|nr:FeoA domain-containing protein [Oscillospiraceae bacterium]